MVNIQILLKFFKKVVFQGMLIIYFLETMSTEEKNQYSVSAFYQLIKLNILKTFLCSEVITSAQVLTEFMVFMMNVKENII